MDFENLPEFLWDRSFVELLELERKGLLPDFGRAAQTKETEGAKVIDLNNYLKNKNLKNGN
jgi:hypothetical protein